MRLTHKHRREALSLLRQIEADVGEVRRDIEGMEPSPIDDCRVHGDPVWRRVEQYVQTAGDGVQEEMLSARWARAYIVFTRLCEETARNLQSQAYGDYTYHQLLAPFSVEQPFIGSDLWPLVVVCRRCDRLCLDMTARLCQAIDRNGSQRLRDAEQNLYLGLDRAKEVLPLRDPQMIPLAAEQVATEVLPTGLNGQMRALEEALRAFTEPEVSPAPLPSGRNRPMGSSDRLVCYRCGTSVTHHPYMVTEQEGLLRYVFARSRATRRTLDSTARSLLNHLRELLHPDPRALGEQEHWKQPLARLCRAMLAVELIGAAVRRHAIPPVVPHDAFLSITRLRHLL